MSSSSNTAKTTVSAGIPSTHLLTPVPVTTATLLNHIRILNLPYSSSSSSSPTDIPCSHHLNLKYRTGLQLCTLNIARTFGAGVLFDTNFTELLEYWDEHCNIIDDAGGFDAVTDQIASQFEAGFRRLGWCLKDFEKGMKLESGMRKVGARVEDGKGVDCGAQREVKFGVRAGRMMAFEVDGRGRERCLYLPRCAVRRLSLASSGPSPPSSPASSSSSSRKRKESPTDDIKNSEDEEGDLRPAKKLRTPSSESNRAIGDETQLAAAIQNLLLQSDEKDHEEKPSEADARGGPDLLEPAPRTNQKRKEPYTTNGDSFTTKLMLHLAKKQQKKATKEDADELVELGLMIERQKLNSRRNREQTALLLAQREEGASATCGRDATEVKLLEGESAVGVSRKRKERSMSSGFGDAATKLVKRLAYQG